METYLADVPVGDAKCNFVSRYVSRLVKVQDENCALNVIGLPKGVIVAIESNQDL